MTIEQLIEKIEKAEGPDRELDCALALDVGGFHLMEREHREPAYCKYTEKDGLTVPGQDGAMMVPHYTASIDAVVRLIETRLPATDDYAKGAPPSSGYKIGLYRGPTPTGTVTSAHWTCMLRRHGQDAGYDHYGKTPALALLSAFLRAYKEQTNDR